MTEIPAVPTELHWSPALHESSGWGLCYSTLDGKFVKPSVLPADAVRLVPEVVVCPARDSAGAPCWRTDPHGPDEHRAHPTIAERARAMGIKPRADAADEIALVTARPLSPPEPSGDTVQPGSDAMHVVSQYRGQEWRDVTPIRAWAEELVSHGGMNAAVGRGVLAKLDEGQPDPSGDTFQAPDVADLHRRLAVVEGERDTALANLRDRRDAGQVAAEAAARIDTACSHGVPSGPEDPVTAVDWDRLLRYARCGGSERVL